MEKFADLGVPFPLFEAPTSEASDYAGLASCRLCGERDRHCFELGIGCAIMPCSTCGTENGLDAHDRKDRACRSCQTVIPFPPSLKSIKNLLVCHECLRAGKAAITKDTEFGMVSWDQALQGITNGVPGLKTDEFELVPIDPKEDWYGVRIPKEHLFELLRTPTFTTWQGERWLFCCKRPMTYLGGWDSVSPDDRRAFLQKAIDADEQTKEWIWDSVYNEQGRVCLYVFKCNSCGRHRATWDMD